MPEIETPQPIKDIDIVLSVLCGPGLQEWDWPAIRQMIDDSLPPAYIQQIAAKIAKDGFAVESETDSGYYSEPLPMKKLGYQITFEGRLFWEQGGYKGKYLRDASEAGRIAELERRQENTEHAALRVNRWIMRGTIGAAVATSLYLAWTVFAYGLDHQWWCFCWMH